MKSNIERKLEIYKDSIPKKGTKEYEKTVNYLKNRGRSEKEIKLHNELWSIVNKSLESQMLSTSNFITEKTLRHYLYEFNDRCWKYGLHSMPFMFNIIEAFFNFRKPHIYFELLKEENYLISLFDYFNYIDIQDFKDNKSYIDEYFVDDLIYNFNIGINECQVYCESKVEYIISGISLIKRKNEITILLTTGKNEKVEFELELDIDYVDENKEELVKSFNLNTKIKKQKSVYIDEENKYSKVIVSCRFDIETETIDNRYIAEEFTDVFTVISDDITGFVNDEGQFINEDFKNIYYKNIETLRKYQAVFETALKTIYLPYFIENNANNIIEEIHETEYKKITSSPLKRNRYAKTLGAKSPTKTLYIVDLKNKFSPDKITLRDDLFKISTTGFWKQIGHDEVGQDKNGNSIHGKTWVNEKSSWFQAKNKDLIINKKERKFNGPNSGYIYIMRNSSLPNNVFKIGMTTKDPETRAKQLSKTSIPDKFMVAHEWETFNCKEAEKKIHIILNDYRIDPRREFFEIDYSKAVKVIDEVCSKINTLSLKK